MHARGDAEEIGRAGPRLWGGGHEGSWGQWGQRDFPDLGLTPASSETLGKLFNPSTLVPSLLTLLKG